MSDYHQGQEAVQVMTTKQPKGPKDHSKPRGSNVTPKAEFHVGRNWSEAQWRQAFKAWAKKQDRLNLLASKKKELK